MSASIVRAQDQKLTHKIAEWVYNIASS